jgi:hypothetical protein
LHRSAFSCLAALRIDRIDDDPPEQYETRSGRAWDTTLAATLARREGQVLSLIDPVYLDTNWDNRLNVEGGTQVTFDINGDGAVDIVHEWNTRDAQLVYDADNNGRIDDGREIMNETGLNGEQNKYRNGWEKVRVVFDPNKNDIIEGAELEKAKFWTDINGNGIVDQGELKTAAEMAIVSISIVKQEFIFKKKI